VTGHGGLRGRRLSTRLDPRWPLALGAAVSASLALFPSIRDEAPGIALLLGLAMAGAVGNPIAKDTNAWAKTLLQVSVVMLGFTMDLGLVLQAGRDGFLLAMASITGTLLLGALLGRVLGIDKVTSALVSAGTAICGGSAIAAVGAAIGAGSAEMAVAMGTVFLLNAIALYLFPILGHLLDLDPAAFGTWAGIAVHDVSSVVGAATAYDPDAVPVATAVKLSRALWIAPVALGAGRLLAPAGSEGKGPPFPWFIGAFLLASAARTLIPALAPAGPWFGLFAKGGLGVVLVLIGAGVSFPALRAIGPRPLVQAVALWAFVALAGLLALG